MLECVPCMFVHLTAMVNLSTELLTLCHMNKQLVSCAGFLCFVRRGAGLQASARASEG